MSVGKEKDCLCERILSNSVGEGIFGTGDALACDRLSLFYAGFLKVSLLNNRVMWETGRNRLSKNNRGGTAYSMYVCEKFLETGGESE